MKTIIIRINLLIFMLFLASFTNIHAQNGPDGGRAALFITYAKKAKKAITSPRCVISSQSYRT